MISDSLARAHRPTVAIAEHRPKSHQIENIFSVGESTGSFGKAMYQASLPNVDAMHTQCVCPCSIGIETISGRSIERKDKIRVITAYDMDAGQKQGYLKRRAEGE